MMQGVATATIIDSKRSTIRPPSALSAFLIEVM